MIEARVEQDREKGTFIMELIGHAGFGELGKDPVCAGASVLAMTAAQCVKTMEEAGRLRKKAHIRIRNGSVLVVAWPKEESRGNTEQLFWVTETGMRLLAEAYPENVKMRGKKEDPADRD